MLMGGLLVHFGQGPVQIEMHFYFFALLSMLCMFANPMVNLAAALTVTVHHLIVWCIRWAPPTSPGLTWKTGAWSSTTSSSDA
jgi:hypothetical protein